MNQDQEVKVTDIPILMCDIRYKYKILVKQFKEFVFSGRVVLRHVFHV